MACRSCSLKDLVALRNTFPGTQSLKTKKDICSFLGSSFSSCKQKIDFEIDEEKEESKQTLSQLLKSNKILDNDNIVVKGYFDNLLWTHNTPHTTLINIFNGTFEPYIRCCDEYGSILARGVQFRYGLDSQYGDVIFVMNDGDWWKSFPGAYGNTINRKEKWNRTKYPVIGHIFKEDFLEYNPKNKSTIDKWMQYEARNFGFRDKDVKSSRTSCTKDKDFPSWCNLQIHLSRNVDFSYVKHVLVPRWFASLASSGKFGNQFARYINNDSPLLPNSGKKNYLNGKFIVYGPDNANDAYSYISSDVLPNMHELKKQLSSGRGRGRGRVIISKNTPKINGLSTDFHNSSTLALSFLAYRDAQIKYINMLLSSVDTVGSEEIDVLFYNISWEAQTMTTNRGTASDIATYCKHASRGGSNICNKNVANVITAKKYDLIGLVEASNMDAIKRYIRSNDARFFDRMGEISKTVGVSSITSFYNKSYGNPLVIVRNFKDFRLSKDDRPCLILIFPKKKLIFINVHMPNKNSGQRTALRKILEKENIDLSYRIIIAGDFNSNVNKEFELDYNKVIYHPATKNLDTCCWTYSNGKHRMKKRAFFDHIFDTNQWSKHSIMSIAPGVKHPSSDHNPITVSFR